MILKKLNCLFPIALILLIIQLSIIVFCSELKAPSVPSAPIKAWYTANGGCSADNKNLHVCYRVAFQFEDIGYRGAISPAGCFAWCNWGYQSPGFHTLSPNPEGATALNIFRVDPENHNLGCWYKTITTLEMKEENGEKWAEGIETQTFKARCPNPVLLVYTR